MRKLAVFLCLVSTAFGQKRPIELKDYYKLESVSAPVLSPDGRTVAYVRTRVIEAENKRLGEIWVSGAQTFMVSNPKVSAANPKWSADGKVLAYDVPGGAPYFVSLGRSFSPPFQIKGVEGTPIFSPDGKWIAYTKKVAPAKPNAAPLSDFDKLAQQRFKGRSYDWMNFRYDGKGYLADPRDPQATPPMELFIVGVTGGQPQQLTHMGVDVMTPAWRDDSHALTFAADLHQRDEYAYERADLFTVNLAGEKHMLTKDDGWNYSFPVWSPDGQKIAALREEGLARVIASKSKQGSPVDLLILSMDGESKNLTGHWDDLPGAPHWSADGKSIYFEGGVNGTAQLFQVSAQTPAETSSVEQLTQGDRVVGQVSFAGDRIAYTSTSPQKAVEVYTASLTKSDEREITDVNSGLMGELQLGKVERIAYDSQDGTSIEGWVVLPPNYESNPGKFPLILMIHGGPHGAYTSSFTFEEQLLAAAGYIVLYTNPRGSTGYGEKFRWGTWGGWGERDFEDVMSGVDYALKHYRADPAKLGVTGYSYGGFLTNWIIGHTTRFAAAVVGAGPSDWISNYGTGDIPRTKETEFLGSPWQENARETMLAHSPVLFADVIKTPTLFLHGEADERVPISQGEEMYTALKKRHVAAKFVRYPAEYHGGWTPWDMVHRYREELLWWREYL